MNHSYYTRENPIEDFRMTAEQSKAQKNLIRRFSNRNNRNFCQKGIDRGSLKNLCPDKLKQED